MNILIFGATGGTGRSLVTQGLEKKHHITAFVRNPAGLTIKDTNLSVVRGDVLNPKEVKNAVKGQDTVISVLGNKTSNALWKANTIISEGVKNIISGMEKQKVKRFLFVASFGINDNIFLPEKLFIRIVLRNIFADIPKQEELIKKSPLDWTIVHPARLVNNPMRGKYKEGENLAIGPFSKIARGDVADFLLKSVTKQTLIGKTMTISY